MSTITAPNFNFASALSVFQQSRSDTRLAEKKIDSYLRDKKTADVTYLVLQGLKQKLRDLQSLPENWDGHGSVQPNPLSIANALAWLEQIYTQIISGKLEWCAPHITASEDGEVMFEWWHGDRKLTLYFGYDNQAEFIRVWGTHIKNEMNDGELEVAEVINLWKWLNE